MDIERHSRMRQIELGRLLTQRRKVYLDACFWIILRDAELGIRTGAAERKLLHFLRCGVQAGRIVCPISAGMFGADEATVHAGAAYRDGQAD